MSHLKQINQKLDTLLERVIVIESLLIRIKVAPPHKTIREQAEETADEHYWDPTKYPTVEDSDTVIGEADKDDSFIVDAGDNGERIFPGEANEHFKN